MQQINKVLYPELSYKICGLCFEAHNKLGRFKSEKSYADFLEVLLKENNVQYTREKALDPAFIGEKRKKKHP